MNKEEIEYMFETLTKQWGDTDNYVNDLLSYSKNLQQENQELKKQYCERTDCSGRLGNSKKVDQLEKELEQLKEIEKEHQRINGELRVENKELKKQLEKYENPEDMTLMMMWATEKVKDENKELKDRIDKAIEYINKKAIKKEIQETRNIVNIIYSLKLNNYEFIELEDILKGDK